MACRLVLRRAARIGSRAFGTIKTDPATCLGPRPDLVDAPLTFDPLQYAFDQGRATGQPVCGVIDDFLTAAECSKSWVRKEFTEASATDASDKLSLKST